MQRRQWICSAVSIGLFLVGAALLIAGAVVIAKVFPDVVTNTVKTSKVLGLNDDGTLNDFTKTWVNPTYVSTMQYWMFDYKNTIGILNRALYPDMDEKGPYAYDEILLNTNLNFSKDGEVMQFAQATRYIFNPSKSCPGCDPKKDTVTIPDISFFIGMAQIDALVETVLGNDKLIGLCQELFKDCAHLAEILEREIGTFMTFFNTGPFIAVTVDELMFSGYVSPLVTKLGDRIISLSNRLLGTKLSPIDPAPFTVILNSENGTTDTLYTMQTGKTDYSRAGYIISFANMSNMSLPSDGDKLPSAWWPAAETVGCNGNALVLEGTNGDFFKSFIKKEPLPIYISDICRSATLQFEKEVAVKGISGYRYLLPQTEFDYSIQDNCGFCNPDSLSKYGAYDRPPNSSCLPTGLLDISGCQQSPIIISKPHFYQASDIVQSFVPRFKPSYENDETTLDIEPITGTVLSANKRLQINMLLSQFSTIGGTGILTVAGQRTNAPSDGNPTENGRAPTANAAHAPYNPDTWDYELLRRLKKPLLWRGFDKSENLEITIDDFFHSQLPVLWRSGDEEQSDGKGQAIMLAYSVLRPGAYPIVWLNESFLMDDGTRDDLQSSLFTPRHTVEIICWCAISLGSFLIILSVALCVANVFCLGSKDEDKDD